jgi:hypothetical protein
MNGKKTSLGLRVFFVLVLISYACSYLFFDVWKTSAIRGGDNWAYYSYLPSIFIYKDIKTLTDTYEARNRIYNTHANPAGMKNRIGEAPDAANGNRVIKYTMGVAALQSPFFLTAHLLQKVSGKEAGGFQFPYIFAVFISVLFYVFLGLYFLQKTLLRWYNPKVVLPVLMAVFFASNLFYFTSFNIGMSHPYLFFLYCLLVYITPRFYDNVNWKNSITLGFAVGMISLIRPAEVLCVLIPVLYGIGNWGGWKEKMQFVRQSRKFILLTGVIIMLVPFPQFYYWKTLTGHWLYDSYPGEHFNFAKPELIRGLFGFKNGWLSYTPIMIFIIPGLYFLWKNKNPNRLAISIILPLHIYIIYSWWCWQYTNGYGSRPMVETYGFLAVALGAAFNVLLQKKGSGILLYAVLFICIAQNIFQTFQIERGRYYSDDATWNFYKQRFFKWPYSYNDLLAYDNNEVQPGMNNIIPVQKIAAENFENKPELVLDSVIKKEGNYAAWQKPGTEYNGSLEIELGGTGALPGDYLKVNAWVYAETNPGIYEMGKLITELKRNDVTVKWNGLRVENKIMPDSNGYSIWAGLTRKWELIHFFVKLPKNYKGDYKLKVYTWNPGGANFRIDDITVELWRKYK